jgi:aminopeptidase N
MRRTALLLTLLFALPVLAERLPQTVVPKHYRITLAPDIPAEKFSGDETIDVDVRQPSASITLNAAEIQFDDASVSSGGRTQKAEVATNASNQTATLTFADPISGAATIDIRFRGILNDKLRGFYISKTPRRKYAVTQFESTDARRAFPSFDEPAFKATFDVSAVIDNGDIAIGNGRVISDKPGPADGKHTVTFAQTRPLPTYLVALLVGDFQCSEGSAGDIPIRVCATPEKVQLTHFAVDAAAKELAFFNDYYGIKYPFGKLDVIGIPDFAAGAMENAAAMTFRESALLVDEKSGSVEAKRRVAGVISHELAHQWFGDLVTMSWWDDVWLNEGFATWMAPKAVAAVNAAWSTDVTDAQATVRSLGSDMLASTRAIRTHVETPAEIESVFDGIAYGKTAAVLRMVESYIGPELFRNGIRAYLTRFSWSNASAEDFWNTMAATTKEPLDRIFSTFVLQPGSPLVTVDTKCEGGKTLVMLSQKRFSVAAATSKEVWAVPVVARSLTKSANAHRFLLTEPEHTFTIAGCTPQLFLNANGRGYYRSRYGSSVLGSDRNLRQDLNVAEKVSLISDEWALVRAGQSKVGDYLKRLDALLADHNPVVVSSAAATLGTIHDSLTTAEDRAAYQGWVRRLLRPIAADAGWAPVAGESDETRSMRRLVLETLAESGNDPQILQRARELAPGILNGTSASTDPQLSATILGVAAHSGDAAYFEELKAKTAAAKSPEEFRMYSSPMVDFTNPAVVRNSLDWALSPAVRSQDRFAFLAGLLANDAARPIVWPYVKEHWSEIEKGMPPLAMARVMGSIGRACTSSERDDVKAFLAAHPGAVPDRVTRQIMERIDNCLAFHEQQAGSLAAFLEKTGEASK